MKPIARKILIDQIKAIVESFDSNEINNTLDEIYEIQKQKNDGLKKTILAYELAKKAVSMFKELKQGVSMDQEIKLTINSNIYYDEYSKIINVYNQWEDRDTINFNSSQFLTTNEQYNQNFKDLLKVKRQLLIDYRKTLKKLSKEINTDENFLEKIISQEAEEQTYE